MTANAFSFDYTTPPTSATQQLVAAFNAAYGQPFFYSSTSSTSSTTPTSTLTSTTASSSSSATSKSPSTTSSTGSSSCSPAGICLSWGYGSTSVQPGVSSQWQPLSLSLQEPAPSAFPSSGTLTGAQPTPRQPVREAPQARGPRISTPSSPRGPTFFTSRSAVRKARSLT